MARIRGVVLAFVGLACLSPAISAAAELCSGRNATLACAKQNFQRMYSEQYQRLWDILNESARAVHDAVAARRPCGSGSKLVEFLGLSTVGEGNAEFGEFLSEHIERLCTDAPACFREASTAADERTRAALADLLESPVFMDAEQLGRAGCLESFSAK